MGVTPIRERPCEDRCHQRHSPIGCLLKALAPRRHMIRLSTVEMSHGRSKSAAFIDDFTSDLASLWTRWIEGIVF